MRRLAPGSHPEANELLARCRTRRFGVLMDAMGHEDMVHLVLLPGDGIYFDAAPTGTGAMPAGTDPATIDRVIALVRTIRS
ncbi:hypothetical protein [Arthrobacter sp. TMS1-12-1]